MHFNMLLLDRLMDIYEAELLGMHAGDGTLYKTRNSLVFELRGGLDEKEYYYQFVSPLIFKLFGLSIQPKKRSGGKSGSFGVQTSSKEITLFLLRYFQSGEKSSRVSIPQLVMNSSSQIRCAFLRGLFDTDGCIRFDKNHTSRNYYPKIELTSLSEQIIKQVGIILTELSIGFYMWKDRGTHRLCIPGKRNLELWMNAVSFHNPKHLNKLSRANLEYAGVAQPGTARMLKGFF